MTSVDKTVAILSTIHGFVPDDAQCEALRERLRVVCTVRDVAFTMHEVALRATASGTSGGNAGTPHRHLAFYRKYWTLR